MPKRSDIKITAVLAGALVDNVGTFLLVSILVSALAATGLSSNEVMRRMTDLNGMLLGLIIGLGCTGLGGYVAAKMAGRVEVLHGALVACLGMIVALIFRERGVLTWVDITGLIGMLPAGMAGGYLAHARRVELKNKE